MKPAGTQQQALSLFFFFLDEEDEGESRGREGKKNEGSF